DDGEGARGLQRQHSDLVSDPKVSAVGDGVVDDDLIWLLRRPPGGEVVEVRLRGPVDADAGRTGGGDDLAVLADDPKAFLEDLTGHGRGVGQRSELGPDRVGYRGRHRLRAGCAVHLCPT